MLSFTFTVESPSYKLPFSSGIYDRIYWDMMRCRIYGILGKSTNPLGYKKMGYRR